MHFIRETLILCVRSIKWKLRLFCILRTRWTEELRKRYYYELGIFNSKIWPIWRATPHIPLSYPQILIKAWKSPTGLWEKYLKNMSPCRQRMEEGGQMWALLRDTQKRMRKLSLMMENDKQSLHIEEKSARIKTALCWEEICYCPDEIKHGNWHCFSFFLSFFFFF
jgi:hypothetical protein